MSLESAELLVIDLDNGADLDALEPVPYPAIVAGVSERIPAVPAGFFDVLLTTVPEPPSPWVACASVPEATADLHGAARTAPAAAIALAQVLRATEGLEVASALAVESMAYSMLQHGERFRAWLRSHEPSSDATTAERDPPVLLARDRGRLDIVLNRPHVHNAFDTPMRDALCEALALVAADETITEVHLRGNGKSFCSGGDLNEFGRIRDAGAAHLIRLQRSVGLALHRCAPRVTTHLHGACIGAGIELAAFAGRIVAAPETTFRLPEVTMGLIPGAGGTVSLPRRIGRHRTFYLALTGCTVDVTTALAWGLVEEGV